MKELHRLYITVKLYFATYIFKPPNKTIATQKSRLQKFFLIAKNWFNFNY
ncbi:hypothetical protein SAMN06265348_10257 [Pedobacter westerhofensis]|uniref:Uncharacterized protein n=1 Tax=Pedobacter westerhofensis TaxID=425512 RepID=A0A521B6M5_9SPHI|nr:hypothetical protein SAMN06265348_10257 [Pedobacter westerhofensis]